MQAAMDVYRTAVEHELQRQAGYRLAYPGLTPQNGLIQFKVHHFAEYAVEDAAIEFADPPGIEDVFEVVERQRLPYGLKLLDYNTSAGW